MSRHARRPRRPTAKDRKREETRARLLDAGRRLFAQYGYDDVPVTEIARDAGVTHGMINVYFGGKAGLLYEIIQGSNAPQYEETLRIAAGPGSAWERLSAIIMVWAKGDARDPRLLSVMNSYSWIWPDETEADNKKLRSKVKAVVTNLIEVGQKEGAFDARLQPTLTASVAWAIYTWGMRTAVFEDASAEDCHRAITGRLRMVLGMDR